jgi:hypothetical protein
MQPQGPYSFQDGTGVYFRPPVQKAPASAKLYVITAPVFWDHDKGEAYAQGVEATVSDTPEVSYDYTVLVDEPLAPTRTSGDAWGDPIYIPTLIRHKQAGADKAASQFASGALYPGRRVWVAERNNRLELLSTVDYDDWLVDVGWSAMAPIKSFSAVSYIEWAYASYYAGDEAELYGCNYAGVYRDAQDYNAKLHFGITGPWEWEASEDTTPGKARWGIVSPAKNQPRLCRFAWGPNQPQEESGTTWGPCFNGDGKMWPGLPGFRLVNEAWNEASIIQLPDGDYATWFIKTDKPTLHYAVATSMWAQGDVEVSALPCATENPAYSYDGSHVFGDITLPLYELSITFPMLNPSGLGGSARKYSRAREPNVAIGDIVRYQSYSPMGANYDPAFIAIGDVYDDPIGTVKMWRGIANQGQRALWVNWAGAASRFGGESVV